MGSHNVLSVEPLIDEAELRCKEQGGRLTEKRKQVLSGLLTSDTALSAYDLVDYCKTEFGQSLPAMSVYRILDFLQEQHLVHKLNLVNKYVACAHITCDHDHGVPQFLICGSCQRVEEISVAKSTINALERSVKDADYHLVSPQLEMNCICRNCFDESG